MLLLVPLALAVPEPPDIELLLDEARTGLRHPPGCWDVTATVTKTVGTPFGKDVEVHEVKGRLRDGLWSDITFETLADSREGVAVQFSASEDGPEGELWPFLPPAFGSLPHTVDDATGASMLIDELLEAYDPDDEVATVAYDDFDGATAFALHRTLTLVDEGKERVLTLETLHDLESHATRSWDAKLDKGVGLGGARAKKVHLSATAGPNGEPRTDSTGAVFVVGGVLRLRLSQGIEYALEGC